MFKKIALWFIKLLRAAGLKKPEKKTYFHESPVHFISDKTPVKFLTVEEAIKSGIDVEKDIKEYGGLKPIYYINGKPEFAHDLRPDVGFSPDFYRNLFKEEENENSDSRV